MMTTDQPQTSTPPEPEPYTGPLGLAGRLARAFIDSPLTPLVVVASIVLGAFAIIATPREEDPQIVVPMMDIIVQFPGASAKEVEERISIPMEKLFLDLPGVKYVYSTSSPGLSFVIVRFEVGENEERRSSRSTTSSTPTSIASLPAPRSPSSSRVPSTTCPSLPSPYGATRSTGTPCAVSPPKSKTRSRMSPMFPRRA